MDSGTKVALDIANQKDRCFCEIGINLGFFTPEQAQQAIETKKIEELLGNSKDVGAFLFEKGFINKEHIIKILRIRDCSLKGFDTAPIGIYVITVLCGLSILSQYFQINSDLLTHLNIFLGIDFWGAVFSSFAVGIIGLSTISCFIIAIHYFKGGPEYLPLMLKMSNLCIILAVLGLVVTGFGGVGYTGKTLNFEFLRQVFNSANTPELAQMGKVFNTSSSYAIEIAKAFLAGVGMGFFLVLIQWSVIRFFIPVQTLATTPLVPEEKSNRIFFD